MLNLPNTLFRSSSQSASPEGAKPAVFKPAPRRTGLGAVLWLALPGLLALGAAPPAQADGGPMMPANMPAAYRQECAACHVAYPPGLLPAASWQRLMRGLDKHYGSDASLDAATLKQLNTWLQANAAASGRVAEEPAQDRITRSAWFERKHRGIDASVWRLASVKSAAQCAACHTAADRGLYDDDHLKFPEGLSPRLRGPWND